MSRARTPALLALACAALLVPASVAGAQDCAGADTPAAVGNETLMGQATLCLLNGQRAAAGLPALAENGALDQSSAAYSRQMVAERFFDHVSPEGVALVPRLTAVGYLPGNGSWNAGENIAWGSGALATPRSIMTAWMNSEGHRDNILSPSFADVGLGVAIGSPRGDMTAAATYTTDFGRHVAGSTGGSLSTYTSPVAPIAVKVTPAPRRAAKTHPVAKAPAHCARTATKRRHGRVSHTATRSCRAIRPHARRHTSRH